MKTIYFWGHSGNSEKACLSNFYPTTFEVGDKKFNCSEQYFMYKKAQLFKDDEVTEKILKTADPKEIKALGRQVKNYNEEVWRHYRYQAMYFACWYKFTQNRKLEDYLLSTENAELVEASPFDRVWGIGYDEKSAEANKADWGENFLGKVLMEVRADLYYEDFDDYLHRSPRYIGLDD